MGRYVPWEPDNVCDRCGAKGAHDFMGDYFCDNCLEEDEDDYVQIKTVVSSSEGRESDG